MPITSDRGHAFRLEGVGDRFEGTGGSPDATTAPVKLRETMKLTRSGRMAALTVGVSLALTLSGCGGSSEPDDTGTANVDLGTVNKATGSPVKVGFIGDAEAGSGALGNGIGAAQASADYAN